ncbi:hypothetical protein HKCCE3408_18095, partial [Rhodobacterales bacterium HKCCE3408]|nr:hypothetical protein [Rhodobacterales bacterium HKCCE3408]
AAAAARAAAEEALGRCLAIAGPPDARLPVSEDLLQAQIAATAEAAPDCLAVLDGLPDAEAGDALYHLGVFAQTSGEHETAIGYYERAAEAGVAAADSRLGDYYFLNIGRIGADVERGIAYYRIAAEAGEPEAARVLALAYAQGRGVDRNMRRAVSLLEQAAEADYHFAQYILGRIVLTGEGLQVRDRSRLNIPDTERGLALLQAAADQGNVQAATLLTEVYSGDIAGLAQDDAERFRLTEAAAETGLPEAINALGFLYERGIGTLPDPQRAAESYALALTEGLDIDDLRGQVDGVVPPWNTETAVAFQQILIDRGLYQGPLDGLVGAGTIAAARGLAAN